MNVKRFIKKIEYPGGENELQKFIKKNLLYPKLALSNNIEGEVLIKYKINPNGNITNISIIKGIGYGCDKEAVRIVKKLKYPKCPNRKINITTTKKILIKFRIPKLSIEYTITN